jgi:IS5 family transposase
MSFLFESLRYMMDKDSLLIKLEAIVNWQPIIENEVPKFLQTDKGCASGSNRQFLKENKIGNGIMDKAKRNTKLTLKQTKRNKHISKT